MVSGQGRRSLWQAEQKMPQQLSWQAYWCGKEYASWFSYSSEPHEKPGSLGFSHLFLSCGGRKTGPEVSSWKCYVFGATISAGHLGSTVTELLVKIREILWTLYPPSEWPNPLHKLFCAWSSVFQPVKINAMPNRYWNISKLDSVKSHGWICCLFMCDLGLDIMPEF